MRFILDDEQEMFRSTLDKLLSAADVPSVTRAWAAGSPEAGRALWKSLAEAGVFAVAVPESSGGAGFLPVELVTAFRVLGAYGVPGPYVETVAAAVLPGAAEWLPRIAEGDALISLASLVPPVPSASAVLSASAASAVPHTASGISYALDADVADLVLSVAEDGVRRCAPGAAHQSIDPARRLFAVEPVAVEPVAAEPVSGGDPGAAFDVAALLCAAQLSGLGDRLLALTVEYAKTRQQFGKAIGEFQAVKHHLADAYVALEHARPLLYGAALAFGSGDFTRDVSAAKAATSEAAYFASRIALQVHGAIGYTDEYDPTLLIRKARALRGAWGAPSFHKARVLDSLASPAR